MPAAMISWCWYCFFTLWCRFCVTFYVWLFISLWFQCTRGDSSYLGCYVSMSLTIFALANSSPAPTILPSWPLHLIECKTFPITEAHSLNKIFSKEHMEVSLEFRKVQAYAKILHSVPLLLCTLWQACTFGCSNSMLCICTSITNLHVNSTRMLPS